MLFRDPSAWYNIILIRDTTESTEANRVKLFVNGVQRMSNSNSMSGQNTSNSIGIGGYHGGAYAFQGALSYYSLYNRALDVSEIDQTHNALKTRFGI